MPISTPLTAGMLNIACPISRVELVHRRFAEPGGTLSAWISTMPPMLSLSSFAAMIASTMRSAATGSGQRTRFWSISARSNVSILIVLSCADKGIDLDSRRCQHRARDRTGSDPAPRLTRARTSAAAMVAKSVLGPVGVVGMARDERDRESCRICLNRRRRYR